MKKVVFVTALVLLWSVSAGATDFPTTSIFFSGDETNQIETLNNKKAVDNHPDIHLGAVLYYGPDRWTIWLQGVRVTPETQRDDLRVVSVQPNEVHLVLTSASEQPEHEIVLKPYQTYLAATGTIVEGIH